MNLQLNEQQQELQSTGRRFAAQYIIPVVEAAKNGNDAAMLTARELMFRKGAELGFTSILVAEEYGGSGLACIDNAILLEELGFADVAIAADYFSLNSAMALLLQRVGNSAQHQQWLSRFASGEPFSMAGAQSEAGVAGSELFSPNPDHGMKTRAERKGDEYVINGSKSAFITNAGVADLYLIMARTAAQKPQFEGTTMFLLDADTAGLSIGGKTELIGWKTTHHAEIWLDDVHVPVSCRLGEEGMALPNFSQVPEMAIGLAACFVGLARRSYQYALAYASERKSWGKPIIEHQSVALKLADMAVDVEAARLLTWDAALNVAHDPMTAGTIKGPAAKSYAVDAAIRCGQRAVEILGGYGVAAEYPTGDFMNDAMVGYACDFTREILKLGMVPFLQKRDLE